MVNEQIHVLFPLKLLPSDTHKHTESSSITPATVGNISGSLLMMKNHPQIVCDVGNYIFSYVKLLPFPCFHKSVE